MTSRAHLLVAAVVSALAILVVPACFDARKGLEEYCAAVEAAGDPSKLATTCGADEDCCPGWTCGSGGTCVSQGTRADAATDAGDDAGIDGGDDAGTDGGMGDGGTDGGGNGDRDAGLDAGQGDAGIDGGVDAGVDGGTCPAVGNSCNPSGGPACCDGATCEGSGQTGRCCAPTGRYCSSSGDCCGGGSCVNNVCTTSSCSNLGQSCAASACCSALSCDPQKGMTCCAPLQASCTDSTQCCTGSSCISGKCESGVTSDGGACLPPQSTCNSLDRCCGPTGQVACPTTGQCCTPVGATCDGQLPCCAGSTCIGGSCTPSTCIAAGKSGCKTSSDCCDSNDVCDNGVCHFPSAGACQVDGANCLGDKNCCSGQCITMPSGTRQCQRTDYASETQGACADTTDCPGAKSCDFTALYCATPVMVPSVSPCVRDGHCPANSPQCHGSAGGRGCVGVTACSAANQWCGDETDCCGALRCDMTALGCVGPINIGTPSSCYPAGVACKLGDTCCNGPCGSGASGPQTAPNICP